MCIVTQYMLFSMSQYIISQRFWSLFYITLEKHVQFPSGLILQLCQVTSLNIFDTSCKVHVYHSFVNFNRLPPYGGFFDRPPSIQIKENESLVRMVICLDTMLH